MVQGLLSGFGGFQFRVWGLGFFPVWAFGVLDFGFTEG